MTIELAREVETQLEEGARAHGVSIGRYIEMLVVETNLRRAQVAQFRAALAQRLESLKEGESADGEEVMAHLLCGGRSA